jgi:hypothetical protein
MFKVTIVAIDLIYYYVMSFNIIEGVFFRVLSLGCFFFGSLN